MPRKKPVRRRKRVSAKPAGLTALETAEVNDAATRSLVTRIAADDGSVIGTYR
jgi:hypothetical protein